MTNSDNKARNHKVPFTMRMDEELSGRLDREAEKAGVSKTAYITMILKGVLQSPYNDGR